MSKVAELSVFGVSDDCIEIEGAIREEFYVHDDELGSYVCFSEGTVLKIIYDEKGLWKITRIRKGLAEMWIDEADDPDSDKYSDVAHFDSNGHGFKWVAAAGEGDFAIAR